MKMIIKCKNCKKKFLVKDSDIPSKGRLVQCGICFTKWFQFPILNRNKSAIRIEKQTNKYLR